VSIGSACRQLGFSKQAYYKSTRHFKEQQMRKQIAKEKVMQVRKQLPHLGGRKLYHVLAKSFKREHLHIGRDKLFDLLREENLLVQKRKRYTKTTYSHHWMRTYPNRTEGVTATHPEHIWVADITYIHARRETCYLHLITDAYSKQIMGYALSKDLAAVSTVEALKMALNKRKYHTSIIHHSDRGLQYCSASYIGLLKKNNFLISMTQDGNPYDNAIAERVNGILKQEFELENTHANLEQSRKQIRQAIELYNNHRPHLSCHMLTPKQMHEQQTLPVKTWRKKLSKSLVDLDNFCPRT
jgi:putative transposase